MEQFEQSNNSSYDVVYDADNSEEAATERRYLWIARTFALISVVSFLGTLILLIALFSLMPVMRVQPFYLTTLNKDQQIVQIQKPKIEDIDMQLLTESLIRQYVLARFTVSSNISEMVRRWGLDGIVNQMSDQTVFAEFSGAAEDVLAQVRQQGLTRSVRILNVRNLGSDAGTNKSVWVAEIEVTSMKQGDAEPVKSTWVVRMRVYYEGRSGAVWEKRLQNPLGFKVDRFGIQAK